jgi:intracellular sulfur oxidation DsrE/DsrF family protein
MSNRRNFLSRLAAVGAALGVGTPSIAGAVERPLVEDPWMSRVKGKHRVVFHSHLPTEGLALRWSQTFLDTQRSLYGIAEQDCTVVVGLNGRSIGWLFNDALWAKYPSIGETMGVASTKNPNTALVAALVPRGVILLACANSLRASGSRFLPAPARSDAAQTSAFAAEAYANLLPGVEVVPSMVVTLQQAQDRGCRYVYAGG